MKMLTVIIDTMKLVKLKTTNLRWIYKEWKRNPEMAE